MHVAPYLNFDGNCREAFGVYADILGGKIKFMQTHGESPIPDQGQEMRERIMHARLAIGDSVMLASDTPIGMYEPTRTMYVMAQRDDPADAERVFHALAEDGRVMMPIQETFWAARFGMLIDRFGIPWMVNCDLPG